MCGVNSSASRYEKGKSSCGHGNEPSHFTEGGEMSLSFKTRPLIFPTGILLPVGNKSLTNYFRSVDSRCVTSYIQSVFDIYDNLRTCARVGQKINMSGV